MKSIVDYTNKLKDFFATKQALTNVETALTEGVGSWTDRSSAISNNTGAVSLQIDLRKNGNLVRFQCAFNNGQAMTARKWFTCFKLPSNCCPYYKPEIFTCQIFANNNIYCGVGTITEGGTFLVSSPIDMTPGDATLTIGTSYFSKE